MFQEIILESIQSHKDLDNFANFIIKKCVEEIQNNFESGLKLSKDNDYLSLNNFLPILTITYNNFKKNENLKKYSEEFLNVFKNFGTITIIFSSENHKTLRASHDAKTKTITIYHPSSQKELKDLIENNIDWMWDTFLKTQKTAIIHELQHWYDSIRSRKQIDKNEWEHNYLKSKQTYKYVKKYVHTILSRQEKIAKRIAYLKLPHEIAARFTQLINNLMHTRIDDEKDAISYLKNNMEGWDVIPPQTQKKLISKTIQIYNDLYFNRKRLPDIKSFIQKYIERRKAQGYNINVYVAPKDIRVEGLDGGNHLNILKDLIKIANSYNQNLIVPQNIVNIPYKTMYQLGFRKNYRHLKNIDVRFGYDEYFKYPNLTT